MTVVEQSEASVVGDAIAGQAADLAEPSAAKKLFDAAVQALGQISIFVHCAAPKRNESETALAVTEAQWDAMLTVGLRAGFVLGQATVTA